MRLGLKMTQARVVFQIKLANAFHAVSFHCGPVLSHATS
jgi:hypothetical protein